MDRTFGGHIRDQFLAAASLRTHSPQFVNMLIAKASDPSLPGMAPISKIVLKPNRFETCLGELLKCIKQYLPPVWTKRTSD